MYIYVWVKQEKVIKLAYLQPSHQAYADAVIDALEKEFLNLDYLTDEE